MLHDVSQLGCDARIIKLKLHHCMQLDSATKKPAHLGLSAAVIVDTEDD